ncbi:MAG: AsnC family transcriptional regulator [Thermoproteota archaeon]|nr:AsnC family transcriptional regulator [Thermoproteota archaeon]
MVKANLDSIDLKILNRLARNGRLSYRSIGIAIGLTTKSVKSRVDNMLASGVIHRFLAVVNPSIIGYNRTISVALRRIKLNQELIDRISLVGDIQYRFEVLGGVVGYGIAVQEQNEEKIPLLLGSLQPAIVGLIESHNYNVTQNLKEVDYSIIKELIKKPRMDTLEIAKVTSSSPKTIQRRMDKMIKNRVLEFSISVNPAAMKGPIVFFLSVAAEGKFHPALLERIYAELHENVISSSNLSRQVDAVGLNLASEDVFEIERIRSKIESFEGIKRAEVFFPTKLEYPQEWTINAINRKLLQKRRQLQESLDKSTTTTLQKSFRLLPF